MPGMEKNYIKEVYFDILSIKMKHLSRLSLFIGLLVLSNSVCAAVYKYTDKNGKVHYSDHPFVYKWLCALAIYPTPNWEMTIAIGRALEPKGVAVNFDNLLLLSRISRGNPGVDGFPVQWCLSSSFRGHIRNASRVLIPQMKSFVPRRMIMRKFLHRWQ